MPHLLVAGATGAGKSVAINSMICSILYKARPDEVRMIMIDPKMIELSIYEGIPHLLLPVVTDAKKANLALNWAVREMERRYQLLSDVNARNLNSYNKRIETGEIKTGVPSEAALEKDEIVIHQGKLPYIVVIVDEFADLMMVSSKEVESSICRLAQKARAAGIHVILATQRPSVDVITGIIKANFPARISFKVTSKHDSRTILDTVGAEHLLGMGDMLFMPPGLSQQTRLHGALVTEKEIAHIVNFLKEQAKPVYNEEILVPIEESSGNGIGGAGSEDIDEFYDHAVQEVSQTKRVSISSIQRKFRIGYNRAARIVELMEQQGVVSAPNGQGQRQVLLEN
jgi:S-DNA-T family DNA segregation ATPase FtsK/SpoIIIE